MLRTFFSKLTHIVDRVALVWLCYCIFVGILHLCFFYYTIDFFPDSSFVYFIIRKPPETIPLTFLIIIVSYFIRRHYAFPKERVHLLLLIASIVCLGIYITLFTSFIIFLSGIFNKSTA